MDSSSSLSQLRAAESGAVAASPESSADLATAESSPSYANNVVGKALDTGQKNGKFKGKLLKSAPIGVVLLGLLLIIVVILGSTSLFPFHVAANLKEELFRTDAVTTEEAMWTLSEYLDEDFVPEDFYDNLLASGIEVGAQAASGEFVHTNSVFASADGAQVATTDGISGGGGKLLVRYKNKTYQSSELVPGIKADYSFYSAFVDALGGDAGIWYGSAGEIAFDSLGIDRNPCPDFVETGDSAKDQETFEQCFAEQLNTSSTNAIEEDGEVNSASDATGFVEQALDKTATSTTRGVQKATADAVTLLNAAVSANDSAASARACAAVIIPVEKAQAGDNGPINQLANLLTTTKKSTYVDRSSLEEKEAEISPAESANFSAVTSGGGYSQSVASRYSRDGVVRSLEAAYDTNSSTKSTIVESSKGRSKLATWIASLFGKGDTRGDADLVHKIADISIDDALYSDYSETYVGESLAEHTVSGCAVLNNAVNSNLGASSASDSEAIAAYVRSTDEIIALDRAADRASRSPLDASSPNTFLGSIVNSLYPTLLSSTTVIGKFASASNLAARSAASILSRSVFADGEPIAYATTYGDCATVPSITSAQGDLYCNTVSTIDSSAHAKKFSTLEGISGYSANGQMDGDYKEFLLFNTERGSTPGPRDANTCAILAGQASTLAKIFKKSTIDNCSYSDTSTEGLKATGAYYSATSANSAWNDTSSLDNLKNYQALTLKINIREATGYYGDKYSPLALFREEYYKEHPLDNSPEGILARRTGLSKDQVIAGIESIQYLAWLDSYDPSSRYAFLDLPTAPEFSEANAAEENQVLADDRRRPLASSEVLC